MKAILLIVGSILIGVGCNSKQENKTVERVEYTYIGEAMDWKNIEFRFGDLIFHTSLSNQSQAIQITTESIYSHVGIIFTEGNQLFVYEAIQPVKITRLEDWVNRGKDGKFILKRIKNSSNFLTNEGIERMKRVGKKYLGKDYDLKFQWSDEKIYCSELVWKIYKEAFNIEIGELEKFSDLNLSNEIVRNKINERFGNNIPMEEFVITPDRMFKAKNLITIAYK